MVCTLARYFRIVAHSATVIMEDGSTTDVSMTNNLTDADRRDMYQNPAKYLGKWIQFITNGCCWYAVPSQSFLIVEAR